jgi:hypothetical protein
MTVKTERLTAREIAKIDGAPRISALQVATLDAAKRTGLRLGVAVEKGAYHVNAMAFATNSAGRTVGGADVRRIGTFWTADAAIACLENA